jgi:hypothetical protein
MLARLCLGQGPRRKDRRGSPRFQRGSSRRPAALFCPAGFGWGRARKCGTRHAAANRQPRLRSALVPTHSWSGLAHAHRSNPPKPANFQRCLSVRAFRDHFSGFFGRFGAYNGPRALISPSKRPPQALQGRLQLAPSVPQGEKLGATCFSASSCQARTQDRARHRPDRASAFGPGVVPVGTPRL